MINYKKESKVKSNKIMKNTFLTTKIFNSKLKKILAI